MFAAGIAAGSAHGDSVKALIRFLQTPESAAVIRKHGLEPTQLVGWRNRVENLPAEHEDEESVATPSHVAIELKY
jgi:hypothetical protein